MSSLLFSEQLKICNHPIDFSTVVEVSRITRGLDLGEDSIEAEMPRDKTRTAQRTVLKDKFISLIGHLPLRPFSTSKI